MKIELIPAIDIIDGKCVRLSQGDYDRRKEYDECPLEVAKRLQDVGIRRLHVVDLDGAASSHIVNYKSLEQIATHTDLMIDFGGGLKTDDDLRIAFECGAAMVTGGSIAVKDAETFCRWLQIYGSERIILGADAKDKKVAVSGWKENSDLELLPFISSYVERGISKVICTDISKDGMLQGPAVELYQEILEQHPSLHLIASGGVGSMDDIKRLEEAGVPAVIFGKALYEGRITMDELIIHNS
ncbi:MAG: 1-(5-phosphoribosyl)-5-[Bacteroidaceae bacterium]|nr:1-(5-phosphoribosyl)-5-[(5-phosphoribosylamino)methylideneamino]imidazole-4-carboxamide isomerase [Bacteroidaceae bacterium]MBR3717703.1 1-(5-phosphoribosyl)-5-[(5-phosphoribosylamino)methylideneamino]imidazole-4-carboxamide isomerase [Bacteroidaceae bacterium]